MNSSSILMGIIPVILFVIILEFIGLNKALLAAIIFAVFEICFSIGYFGQVDSFTYISVGIMLFMAILSYVFRGPIYFKLAPSLMSLVFGIVFLFTHFTDDPMLVKFLVKYQEILGEQAKIILTNQSLLDRVVRLNYYMGYAMIVHAFLTVYAAYKLSNWWWAGVRVAGFYLCMFIAFIAVLLF